MYIYPEGGKPDISPIRSIFSDQGKFIDPLSTCKGYREIENAFTLLLKFFTRVEFRETKAYTIQLQNASPNFFSGTPSKRLADWRPQATVIVCENDQDYYRPGKQEPFAVKVLTTLELDGTGQWIVLHRDQWLSKGDDPLKKAMKSRDTSFFYNLFARGPLTLLGGWYAERYRKTQDKAPSQNDPKPFIPPPLRRTPLLEVPKNPGGSCACLPSLW
eukprot:tig00000754_g3886.t1